ncbi:hypothetical protein [Flavobacterium collinsii]|uniref:hypothetical protein n=1 Tax=Flavobacterium collinsii TaxID=1114861 RepID=UPI0024927607|nr:hypothetical protein [Flavobacterium collinsii]
MIKFLLWMEKESEFFTMKFQILQERLYGLANSYTYNAAGYPEKASIMLKD